MALVKNKEVIEYFSRPEGIDFFIKKAEGLRRKWSNRKKKFLTPKKEFIL